MLISQGLSPVQPLMLKQWRAQVGRLTSADKRPHGTLESNTELVRPRDAGAQPEQEERG
jgi:hypothetical protein